MTTYVPKMRTYIWIHKNCPAVEVRVTASSKEIADTQLGWVKNRDDFEFETSED